MCAEVVGVDKRTVALAVVLLANVFCTGSLREFFGVRQKGGKRINWMNENAGFNRIKISWMMQLPHPILGVIPSRSMRSRRLAAVGYVGLLDML